MIDVLKTGRVRMRHVFYCLGSIFSLLFSSFVQAQDFAGFRTGNYTGVTGVFSNPANIAGSRYRWDVQLFSLNALVANDKADFKLSDLSKTLNGDSLKNKIAGPHSGYTNALVNMTLTGPSFMLSLGKNAIAFTTRTRVMVNVRNVDGTLISQFASQDANDASLPYSFATASNNRISINAWTEFGASFGRVLLDQGVNYLKGGITLKYLAGMANGYLQMDQLQGTLGVDNTNGVYMTNTAGTLGLGFGGTSIDDIKNGHLGGFKSSGFGADLGLVYEFKPEKNGYLLRAGVALLDVGSISYTRDTSRSSTYTAHISSAQKAYINDFGAVDNYKQFMQSHPQYFTPAANNNAGSYGVGLPTTLQLDLDYHIFKGLYTNLNGQFSLASGDKPANSNYYNAYTLTPRYEGRKFGFYLPLNYNQLTHFNAGFCFRAGPFFVGTASALSAAFGSSKQADFFFGFRFGGLKK